ncbi:histidine kinase [Desulfuromonas versatilis]|uniref:histidine kinase n=1 Tax=Desulfuromonas versatilis TaxID=2802975 RepID=A0ABM8HR69_9BACT|nr:transporter substrate-binding domain-containing protein [Desulfuromonas versatilis]BCR04408.1 histidine kinase [Desulfuromonas versatilis]
MPQPIPSPFAAIARQLPALLLTLALLLPGPAWGEDDFALDDAPIIVGGDHNYPPYEYLDKSGLPTGYNIELTRAIADVMGMNVEIRLGDWGDMRNALAAGRVDILQGMAFSEERVAEVDFSTPHTVVYQAIWTRKGEEAPRSLDFLKGREVIVMRGSIMHDFMLKHDFGATLIFTPSLLDGLRLLAAGRHDCALVAKLPGEYLVREYQLNNLVATARPIAEQPYGYAVRKGNTAMLARFSEGLAILKKSGRYQQIHNKWLGVLEPGGVQWTRIVKYVALVAIPLLLILGGTMIWTRMLKKEVAHRTRELEQEIVERKRAMEELAVRQRQLIQADKMTSLGILVSGVAHEINNPNGLILLNLPLLHKAFGDAEPILERHFQEHGEFRLGWLNYSRMRSEIPQLFEETIEGAKRIKRIVEDLKDFARRDDSDFSSAVDFNKVVEAAVRLVDASIRGATDHFSATYAAQLPSIKGNPQRIEQVVVNLILNACQALRDKHEGVFLKTALDAAADRVILEVRDEGRGIDPEHLPHLTDPFFTTKRESGGTGLGLSVSAGIVKEHGGTLQFYSAPGQGMTAVLALPVAKENA